MRRLMLLVTVVLVMTAMFVASAAPVAAFVRVDVTEEFPFGGTSVPTVVCETTVASPVIGWKGGQCWIFHPVSAS